MMLQGHTLSAIPPVALAPFTGVWLFAPKFPADRFPAGRYWPLSAEMP